MANVQRVITVTAEDRDILESLVRASSTPAGLSRRARAVLLMAEGLAGTAIAERTGYTPVQISRLRARFATEGVLGLGERPRSGRPATVTAATGYSIGGVPPIGHPEPVRTLVDESLLRYDEVWSAAGDAQSVFAADPERLVEWSGGAIARIATLD